MSKFKFFFSDISINKNIWNIEYDIMLNKANILKLVFNKTEIKFITINFNSSPLNANTLKYNIIQFSLYLIIFNNI